MRSVAVVALAASLAVPGVAAGVELEVAAQTLAQGYQLRARRYDGAVWFLNRRRVTQTLSRRWI